MKLWNVMCAALLITAAGCTDAENAPNAETAAAVSANPQYVSTTEPDGAIAVGEAREVVEDEQAIAVVGKIGGSSEPFVEGLAAFTIVDPKVPYCSPDEGCPTPWDYCCTQDQVKNNIATVKIVDDGGNPVADDARTLLGVKELSTVVVQGQAKRDDQGNLTIAATKVFVRTDQ